MSKLITKLVVMPKMMCLPVEENTKLALKEEKVYVAGAFAGGDGTASSPYLVTNAAELDEVRSPLAANTYFKLTQDIDLSSIDNWVPIGDDKTKFEGKFDGDKYVIRHLTINRAKQDYIGLFGYVGSDGVISNLIVGDINVAGNDYVGGLVGLNCGCINDSYVAGSVTGNDAVGGLVGYNSVGNIHNSYLTGSITGNENVGGLVGHNSVGNIHSSYATGSVTGDNFIGGDIKNSYATGSVTGNINIGGLVGFKSGSVDDCFYDRESTGVVDNGIGEGKSTEDMKLRRTFNEWDTRKIWLIDAACNNGYPSLRKFN